jgi:HAD superfamily hydrolase (TIGR01509 family)
MIKILLFDLSYTLLFPKDKSYRGELNQLHKELSKGSNYNFSEHFYLDMEQLGYLKSLKDKCDLYMFTSGTIQNAPEIKNILKDIFKKIYSAEEIGLGKKDPESFRFIVKDLGVNPSEILFVDDLEKNVTTAKEAGLNAIVYKDFASLKEDFADGLLM